MKWAFLLVCFLAVALPIGSEPLVHPVSGEAGFWLSRSEFETTVIALEQNVLYEQEALALRIVVDEYKKTNRIVRGFLLAETIGLVVMGLWVIFGAP